jgi:hypothetical protein
VLLDNCPAHNAIKEALKESHPYIHVIFFPPNLTNCHQPMDQGIIKMLKSHYRSQLLESLVHIYEDEERLHSAKEAKKQAKRGQVGVAHGEKPHILDAIEMLESAWNEKIDCESVVRCWRKAECLPPLMQMTLNAEASSKVSDRPRVKIQDELVCDLCESMEKLSAAFASKEVPEVFAESFFEENSRGTSGETSDRASIREMAETWIELEDLSEVRDALAEEMIDDIMEAHIVQASEEYDNCEDAGIDNPDSRMEDNSGDNLPTVTFLEVEEQLLRVGEYVKVTGSEKLQAAHAQFWRLMQQERTKSRGATNNKQASLFKFYQPGSASGSNTK